jgi:hypothetical protein
MAGVHYVVDGIKSKLDAYCQFFGKVVQISQAIPPGAMATPAQREEVGVQLKQLRLIINAIYKDVAYLDKKEVGEMEKKYKKGHTSVAD